MGLLLVFNPRNDGKYRRHCERAKRLKQSHNQQIKLFCHYKRVKRLK
jgi:hypothetical protein